MVPCCIGHTRRGCPAPPNPPSSVPALVPVGLNRQTCSTSRLCRPAWRALCEPAPGGLEDCNPPVRMGTLAVVVESGCIGSPDRSRQVGARPVEPAPHVRFGNRMPALGDAVGDAVQRHRGRVHRDVVQLDPVAGDPGCMHPAERGRPSERCFDDEGSGGSKGRLSFTDGGTACRSGSALGIIGRDPARDSIGVDDARFAEAAGFRQRGLSGAVRPSDEVERRLGHTDRRGSALLGGREMMRSPCLVVAT